MRGFQFEVRAELSLKCRTKADAARVRRAFNDFWKMVNRGQAVDGAAEKRFAKRVMALAGKTLADAEVKKLWCEDFDESVE